MKPVSYRKRKAFFKALVEGKAKLGKYSIETKHGRRGKGKNNCFWVKDRHDGKEHWLATFKFNQLLKKKIQKKQLAPIRFELCELPLYFVAKSQRAFDRDLAVSHYIRGPVLGKPLLEIARKLGAPIENVVMLQTEMERVLNENFLACKEHYWPIFRSFRSVSLDNVIVQSYDPKTKKFKVFVVDV